MRIERASIPIGKNEQVSAVLSVPEGYRPGATAGVILAHGAGNDMDHPLIVYLARGLAEAGHLTLRFNFLYRERGRKSTDTQNVLVRTWQSVDRFFRDHPRYRPDVIVAAGKSMGGRVASQMVAEGLLEVDRLVFLGYPLHPPGNRAKVRDAHLYQITVPMLFFTGTRDSLCHLPLLEGVLQRLSAPWVLETIEGGDHSFRLPKSAGVTEKQVYQQLLVKITEWLAVK